jgi:hypothetical protein
MLRVTVAIKAEDESPMPLHYNQYNYSTAQK